MQRNTERLTWFLVTLVLIGLLIKFNILENQNYLGEKNVEVAELARNLLLYEGKVLNFKESLLYKDPTSNANYIRGKDLQGNWVNMKLDYDGKVGCEIVDVKG